MSTALVPTAPRAMLSEISSNSAISAASLEQLFATATKELYPRLALFEALAEFKNDRERRIPTGDDIVEARRNFLDSFAYLCDVEKGGGTVTAVGLQKLTYGNILWLAANEGVRDDVKIYARVILSDLKSVDRSNERTVQETIFHLAVKNCDSRISIYKEEVRRYARNCRMQLRSEAKSEAGEISRGNKELSFHMRRIIDPLSVTSSKKTQEAFRTPAEHDDR